LTAHRAEPATRMIGIEDEGSHGTYLQGNPCATPLINTYLTTGKLPATDIVCPGTPPTQRKPSLPRPRRPPQRPQPLTPHRPQLQLRISLSNALTPMRDKNHGLILLSSTNISKHRHRSRMIKMSRRLIKKQQRTPRSQRTSNT
ncbi:hypothetical protein GZ206_02430, partial [Dermatophilus congolensis]|nr:hypothetical protein [Dermatophilus congolensis]